ncbi:hypothetical protein VULLAG_LOCUS1949 [Vulpes lagopus]
MQAGVGEGRGGHPHLAVRGVGKDQHTGRGSSAAQRRQDPAEARGNQQATPELYVPRPACFTRCFSAHAARLPLVVDVPIVFLQAWKKR